ncbi:MAG: deoxyribose-phosphate aldolase [Dictyoglomus sp.]|nr:deoxyribose-phosphate aldolase [Dictyoglomus sp.]MCX7941671.1 deoxyribose-phosphate aldolase [Dictyoglomaceae bacterium]MDW8188177.1 deoxyribose-phosphate aldolase [Dictyoglomus sp.]
MDKKTLAKMIDHTLLRPDASSKDIEEFCKEALEYNFMSVCVQPYFVPLVYKLLKDSEIKICTVIDFPHGSNSPSAKAFQIEELLKKGAEEFDIVVNISAIKDRNEKVLREEIKKAVETASGKIVKIIIETCYLTDDEKVYITNIIKEEGAHFVKTSTGFGPKGAEIRDIILLKKIAENKLKIKASGGIRTLEQALSFINAGADRLGTSQSIKILKELNE